MTARSGPGDTVGACRRPRAIRRVLAALAVLASVASLVLAPAHGTEPDAETTADADRRAAWITAAGVGTVALYGGAAWWRNELSGNFRVGHEGWFGQDTYAGGADKLGHGFSTYLGTRLMARAYEEAGQDPATALRHAVAVTAGTLMAVEVLDGFSKRYRFSPEDAVMNLLGVGLGWTMERNPELDRLLDVRVHYRRSEEARRAQVRDPIADYSGQTYLLVFKAAGVPALVEVPGMRYLELSAGYGSRGYRPELPGAEPRRYNYLGISINLAEVLKSTVFDEAPPASRSARMAAGTLEYLQLPGTAALTEYQR